MRLFHIVKRADWEVLDLNADYEPASLASEGFIHLSIARQLLASAKRYFEPLDEVLVVDISETAIAANLRFDQVRNERFPHLYGSLPRSAVIEVVPLPANSLGEFGVPAAWLASFEQPSGRFATRQGWLR